MKKILTGLSLVLLMLCFFALGFFLRDMVPTDIVPTDTVPTDSTVSSEHVVANASGFYYTENGVRGTPSVLELREDGTCRYDDKSIIYRRYREGTWTQNGEEITLFLPAEYDETVDHTWEETTKSLHLVDNGLICDSYFFEKK